MPAHLPAAAQSGRAYQATPSAPPPRPEARHKQAACSSRAQRARSAHARPTGSSGECPVNNEVRLWPQLPGGSRQGWAEGGVGGGGIRKLLTSGKDNPASPLPRSFILFRFQLNIKFVFKRFQRTPRVYSLALVKICLGLTYSKVWLCGFSFIRFVTLLVTLAMKIRIKGLN